MRIEVNLFASLRKYLPENNHGEPVFLDVDQGTTVGQLLDRFNVPAEIPKIIFINGLTAKAESALNDGDRAGIFPLVAGG
ncbi:MAG: MoaD/ThiS family protein [Deltaproteobacteria bacterium]|nr:MoaD/ThiS family protein [Deltaproteobacteria bacterium]